MSARITLVILGCACLPGCGPGERPKKQTTESPVEQSPRKIAPTKPEQTPRPTDAQNPLSGNNPQFRGTAQAMERERIRLDRTVYRHEMEAQAYGSTFVSLWDRLRSTEPFKVLRQFPFVRLEYRLPTEWKPLPLGMAGIRQAMLNGKPISLDHPGYLAQLKELEEAGWKIIQTEWHHSEFRPDKKDERRSLFFRSRSIRQRRTPNDVASSRASLKSRGRCTRPTPVYAFRARSRFGTHQSQTISASLHSLSCCRLIPRRWMPASFRG